MPLSRFQPTFLQPPPMTAPPRLGQLPVSTASPVASGVQGLLQGYMAAQKIKAAEKNAKLEERKAVIENGQALLKALDNLQKVPAKMRGKVAPSILSPFVDIKSDEGKAFVAAVSVDDPEAQMWANKLIAGIVGDKNAQDALINNPEIARGLRTKPISTINALRELSEQKRTANREGEVSNITRGLGEAKTPSMTRDQLASAGFLKEAESLAKSFGLNKEKKPPIPAFLDETGRVKPAVSSRIQRMVGEGLGGRLDEAGRVLGLPSQLASQLPELTRNAESKLSTGEARSLGDAVTRALTEAKIEPRKSLADLADNIIDITEKSPVGDEPDAEKLLNVQDATGLTAGVKDFVLNQVLGQVFPDVVDKNVVAARQELALLANDFIVAEKRSPRLPVWEQMRLSRIFTEPSVWRSPEQVRLQLKSFDQRLSDSIRQEKEFLKAPVGEERKQEALSNIREAARFRKRVRKFNLKALSRGVKKEAKTERKNRVVDFEELKRGGLR